MKIKLNIIICIICCSIFLPAVCLGYDYFGSDKPMNTVETWGSDSNITDPAKSIMQTAVTTIRIVGTGIAIIMLTYIAIKYMSAAPQEKAEFKKSATAYIVGAIILFGASNIIGIIYNFAGNNVGTTEQTEKFTNVTTLF